MLLLGDPVACGQHEIADVEIRSVVKKPRSFFVAEKTFDVLIEVFFPVFQGVYGQEKAKKQCGRLYRRPRFCGKDHPDSN